MRKRRHMKRKTGYKLLLFLFIFCLAAVGIIMIFASSKLDVKFKQNIDIKMNDTIYYNDLIESISNGTLKDNSLVDTSTPGGLYIKMIVLDKNNNEHEYSILVDIKDNVGPTITFNDKLTTEVGKQINLLDGVSAKDNDKDIEVKVEGDYDFNKAGEYKLYYVAKDDNNNETKKEFTLVVKEKKQETNNNNTSNNNTTTMEHTKEDGEFTTSKGFKGVVKNGVTYIDGVLIANKTYALPSTYNPGLSSDVSSKAQTMFNDAKKEGLNIYIVSGFRSYDTQNRIYNKYVANDGKKNADTYSARPGHSEHQSGLAFDVCQDGYACVNAGFDNTPPANWLSANAYKYGFILRYPKGKTNETGYIYESWHFRYVGVELATKLYNNGNWITLEDYFGITSEYDY